MNIQSRITNTSIQQRQQRTKTMSSLVAAYLKGDDFEVQLPTTGVISLRKLFIEINGQQIADFEDDMRIYYGKAWVNKQLNGNGFSVRFVNALRHKHLKACPTFFINDKAIKQTSYRKFQQTTLETLATNKPIDIYILSAIGPYLHKSGKYINFKLEGLEYLKYR